VSGSCAERLLVTVYHTDDEAYDIWHEQIGLPAERIIRIGDNKGAPYASDNFWQMADTGPCGPCTEIFYDHGAHIAGGPPGSPDEDGDASSRSGTWCSCSSTASRRQLQPLAGAVRGHRHGPGAPGRGAAARARQLRDRPVPAPDREGAGLTGTSDLDNKSLRVIADHIRACSFLIVDGVLPSNEGRGYVLRRIIRRACVTDGCLACAVTSSGSMVAPLVEVMGDAYPELIAKRDWSNVHCVVKRSALARPWSRACESSTKWPRVVATPFRCRCVQAL
jgi:alanyl-tRNA synthetase